MDQRGTIDGVRRWVGEVGLDGDERLAQLRHELVELCERQARAVSAAVAELTEFARGDRAPRELRDIQRRVDRGELTWERVVLGPGDLLGGLLGEHLAGRAPS